MNTPPQQKLPRLQILLTGNELMSGHTVDSNSAMIAQLLASKGLPVSRKVTVGDEFSQLVCELESLAQASDVIIVNGGLGPTIDDLTAQAISELTGTPLKEHPEAMSHLAQWCTQRKLQLNDANLKQAILPADATIIPNPTGSAVGFSVKYKKCLIICTPGVPSELKLMMEQSIVDLLADHFQLFEKISTIRFQTFGLGESSFQQLLNNEYPDWPKEVELGFRAGIPLLEIKLTIREERYKALQQQCYQRLSQLISEFIVGEESTSLAQAVITELEKSNKQLTTAESCTGGAIAAAITEVAGASSVFEAGFVTYSNVMKEQLIGVSGQSLEQQGAVSEEVAREMLQGAISESKAQYGVAVTGIAGPDGGSEEKPVGTVWIAWGTQQNPKAHRFQLPGERKWFQQMVTAIALDLLRRDLLGIDHEPRYFSRFQ